MSVIREIWRNPVPHAYDAWTNAALLVGRVIVAIPLLPNGFRKLADFGQVAAAIGGVPQVIGGRHFPDQQPLVTFPMPEFFLGASVAFDLLGGLLLLVGWRARSVGTMLAGYVLIAMVIFHSDIRGPADVQAILRNAPLVAALLMLGGVGGGAWSVDGWLARRNGVPALAHV
jgi:putative oxidoreductase